MLNALGDLIFYDRYAKKDLRRLVKAGDLVVVCPNPTATESRRVLGSVLEAVGEDRFLVALRPDGEELECTRNQLDLPVEDFAAAATRIATAVGVHETTEVVAEFEWMLAGGYFVPAGRIWAGAGIVENLTPYNCFVLPPPTDSRAGIVETLNVLTEIMSRGGGVGIPIMSLRPKHAVVRGVNGRSSGSVAWAELYSFGTGLIEQGGSRRGALMLLQYDWHPDIIEFITAKKDRKRLTNANVSVAISDEFMAAKNAGADWQLVFPDTAYEKYETEWDGDLPKWKAKGYPVVVHRTLPARELWNMIVEAAHASAEPGLLFISRYNEMSNSFYYEEGAIYCTNPCAEQGIPSWAVCNLGHLNLSKFLLPTGINQEAQVNWGVLELCVRLGVRFLDDVIEVAKVPFEANRRQQELERRIGLGTMGLAEMLIRRHICYGNNPKCLEALHEIYSFIACKAYEASVELSKEKGSFTRFSPEIVKSGFLREMPQAIRDNIVANGLRNVCILTQAPTGTVGTMMGTSTGIEPYPWLEWEREGRLGKHLEMALPLKERREAFPDSTEALPVYFVTASQMTPEDHVYTQAAIQRWTDSSISKTSNLPENYTVAQVDEYYQKMYDLGCKGGTVYRDQSRSKQVLRALPQEEKRVPDIKPVPEAPYPLRGVGLSTPLGKLNVKLGLDPVTGEPFEVWLDVSRSGTVMAADREAMARLISLVLRLNSPVAPATRVRLVVDQLQGIGGGDSTGFGADKVLSVPDGIAKALGRLLSAIGDDFAPVSLHAPEVCPECHQAGLAREAGCESCRICGWSKC